MNANQIITQHQANGLSNQMILEICQNQFNQCLQNLMSPSGNIRQHQQDMLNALQEAINILR